MIHNISLVEIVAHDDVIKWKHLPRYCPFVRVTGGEQTIEAPVIWDATTLIMISL